MGSDRLPDGWRCYPLRDPRVCVLNPPKREVRDRPDSTKVTFVPMAAVDDESGSIVAAETRDLGQVRKGYTYFAESDVVFAKITPCMENGKAAVARGLVNGIGFGTTEFHVLRAGPQVIPEWLHAFVRRADIRAAAKENMHGAAGQQRVPVEFLEQLEMPVPPTQDEQRRIIARIEKLTARLDQARRLHRQAQDEFSRIILAAIHRFARDIVHEFQTLREYLADKPRNGWSPIADAAVGTGMPVLTLSAVTGFHYDGTRVKWTSLPTRPDAHYWLAPGDLLITRSNTPELVGHAAIYDGTPAPCICSDLVMKMRVNPAKADVRFVHYWLQTGVVRNHITSRARGTSGTMKKIAQNDVQEIPVPKVPLAEQRRIVAHLDGLSAQARSLQHVQTEIAAELESFTSALLAKAFRGEL